MKLATNRKSSRALPKVIYVKEETDQNDPDGAYLMADETPESFEDGDIVGVYELQETRVKTITHAFRARG